MDSIRRDHPLRRLFAGMVENAFCAQVGLCDPALTEYLADLLVDFTHIDRLKAVRNAHGRRLEHIAAMLVAMSDEPPEDAAERDRTMYRRIGDYTLFWAGVYPEHLKPARNRGSDVLLEYVTQGKRSYAIVSELAHEDETPPATLFKHLSDEFEYCLYGLGLVRRGWEQAALKSPPGGELLY